MSKQSSTSHTTADTSSSKSSAHSLTGPTYLTLLRMLMAIFFVCFALIPEFWAHVTALVIFVFASLTDKIDGNWARKSGQVTDLGAFLDPLADKMLVDLAFLVLVYTNVIPLWTFAVIIVRDLAVDGMRMMAAKKGITIAASFLGKLKTTLQMIALIIILLNLTINFDFLVVLGNIFLYAAITLTIYSGLDYLVRGYRDVIK